MCTQSTSRSVVIVTVTIKTAQMFHHAVAYFQFLKLKFDKATVKERHQVLMTSSDLLKVISGRFESLIRLSAKAYQ